MSTDTRVQPTSHHDIYTKNPIDGLAIPTHDYVALAQASLTDTYTFRKNTATATGVSGTLVATITITYTDSGKGTISSVEKT